MYSYTNSMLALPSASTKRGCIVASSTFSSWYEKESNYTIQVHCVHRESQSMDCNDRRMMLLLLNFWTTRSSVPISRHAFLSLQISHMVSAAYGQLSI